MLVAFGLTVTAHNFVHVQLVFVAIGTKQNFIIIEDGFFAIKFVLTNATNIPILADVVKLTARTFFVFQYDSPLQYHTMNLQSIV